MSRGLHLYSTVFVTSANSLQYKNLQIKSDKLSTKWSTKVVCSSTIFNENEQTLENTFQITAKFDLKNYYCSLKLVLSA